MRKEIVPVFGLHTTGDEYYNSAIAASRAMGMDLIPNRYGWPDYTGQLVRKLRPIIIAIDGVENDSDPRSIPYSFPANPFELKGDRKDMFLIGADINYHSVQLKGLGDLATEAIKRYWENEGETSPEQKIKSRHSVDHMAMLAITAAGMGSAFLGENGLALALFGAGTVFTLRLPAYEALLRINDTHQFSRKSKLFRGLLRFSRPLSMRLIDINLRNALVAVKLTDTQDYLQIDEHQEGSAVALFGNGHALGRSLWNDPKAQERTISQEVRKIFRIAQELNQGNVLDERQKKELEEDLSSYLGETGIWRVLNEPKVMSYRNFANSMPFEGSFISPTIKGIVGNIVNNS